MSTLSKEVLLTGHAVHAGGRDPSSEEGAVLGTIAIGLGSMQERLEMKAVEDHLASGLGPEIPPALKKKERRLTGSLLRGFLHDETSLPIAEPGSKEWAREWRVAALSAVVLVVLILLFLLERGLLGPWIQKFFG